MNKDLPRVLKLLREEKGLKQVEAADQMGVAQAVLSHYENGKRECGLDFLVSAANFYNVSVDYILGRTSSRTGVVVSESDLADSTISESFTGNPADAGTLLRKKLITNSLEIVFSLLMKTKNTELTKAVGNYLLTAVYRAYRMVYSAGGINDENNFSISSNDVSGMCSAKMTLEDIKASTSAKSGTADGKITASRIESEYARQSAALFSIVTNVERDLNKFVK